MADEGMGVRQEIQLVLDMAAMAELERDLVEASTVVGHAMQEAIENASIDKTARQAALKRVEEIRHAVEREAESLKRAVAEGLLTAEEARTLGTVTGNEFAQAVEKELKNLKDKGILTNAEIGVLGKRITDQLGVPFKNFTLPEPNLSLFQRGLNTAKRLAAGAAGAIAAFFSFRALFRFGRDAVRSFLEADRVQSQLETTVQRMGLAYSQAAPHVDKLTKAFVDQGRGSGEDAKRTLQELLAITGDFRGSLEAVGLASDFAAKHGVTLERATELIGRAMVGQTRPLERFGIEVKDNETALDALRRSVGGFVENEGPRLQKSVNRLQASWGDLKQSLGEVLVTGAEGESAFDSLTIAVQDLTRWVRDNKEELAAFAGQVVRVAGAMATELAESFRNTIRDAQLFGGIFDTILAKFERLESVIARIGAANALRRGDAETAARQLQDAIQSDQEAERLEARARQRFAGALGPRPLGGVSGGASSTAQPDAPKTGGGGGGGSGDEDKAAKAQRDRIQLLIEATKHERTRAEAMAELLVWEARINGELQRVNLSLRDRVELEGQLEAIQKAIGQETPIRERSLEAQVDFYAELLELTNKRGTALRELARLEAEIQRQIAGTLDPVRIRELEEQLERIGQARREDQKRQGGTGPVPGIAPIDEDEVDRVVNKVLEDLAPKLEDRLDPARQFLFELFGMDLREIAADTAHFIGDEFDAVFERLYEDGATLQETLGGLAKGLAAGMARELAELAGMKSRENLAEAVEQTAKGIGSLFTNPAKAASHFASAAKHLAAAAAWSAVGGAAGSAAGGLSNQGGGGGRGGSRDFGERDGLRVEPGDRGTRIIEIVGSDLINLSDRRAMDQLQEALALADGYNVIIRRGRF